MGLFSGMTAPKDQAQQLLLRDDGSSEFRRLGLLDGFLVEKDRDDTVLRAWMHLNCTLARYKGGAGGNAGMVTVSIETDVLYDPFEQTRQTERPDKGDNIRKRFAQQVADARCHTIERNYGKGLAWEDKILLILGAALIMELIIIGLEVM